MWEGSRSSNEGWVAEGQVGRRWGRQQRGQIMERQAI